MQIFSFCYSIAAPMLLLQTPSSQPPVRHTGAIMNIKMKSQTNAVKRIGSLAEEAVTTVFAGMIAPPFALTDQHGKAIDSAKLLARGPLVIFFFRDLGCVYCKRELAAVERAADLLLSRGGNIVGISRYGADDAASLCLETSISFPILNDRTGSVIDAFGLPHIVSSDIAPARARDWGPVPARFVIAPNGVVAYGDADPDYTHRPDAAELAPLVWGILAAKMI